MRIRESEKALLRVARIQAVEDWHRHIGLRTEAARQSVERQIAEAQGKEPKGNAEKRD